MKYVKVPITGRTLSETLEELARAAGAATDLRSPAANDDVAMVIARVFEALGFEVVYDGEEVDR